jgi:hypothetical protein
MWLSGRKIALMLFADEGQEQHSLLADGERTTVKFVLWAQAINVLGHK